MTAEIARLAGSDSFLYASNPQCACKLASQSPIPKPFIAEGRPQTSTAEGRDDS